MKTKRINKNSPIPITNYDRKQIRRALIFFTISFIFVWLLFIWYAAKVFGLMDESTKERALVTIFGFIKNKPSTTIKLTICTMIISCLYIIVAYVSSTFSWIWRLTQLDSNEVSINAKKLNKKLEEKHMQNNN